MKGAVFLFTVQDKKRILDNQQLYNDYMELLPDGEYVLSVKKKRKHKSIDQNSYYWATLTMVCQEIGLDEPMELHEEFKRIFNPKPVGKMIVGGSTKEMSTVEMKEFMDKVFRFIEDPYRGLGIKVPNPEQFYTLLD